MVIDFCKSYLLQINCANGMNIVFRTLIKKFPIRKYVGGFTIQYEGGAGGKGFSVGFWTQHMDQLPVGLLAQLVERCTGSAKVMGSNPVRA